MAEVPTKQCGFESDYPLWKERLLEQSHLQPEQFRTCPRCKELKPLAAFKRKKPSGWQAYCTPCRVAYRNQHYRTNKQTYCEKARQSMTARRARIRETIENAKKGEKCADCNKAYPPWKLQFDHLDPASKDGSLANMVARGVSVARVLSEIAKCEIVCANCHAGRTYWRRMADPVQQ